MPRVSKRTRAVPKPRGFYTVHPWECSHDDNRSEISAYVEASGKQEVIAIVRPTSGASAETMATFIVDLINDYQKNQNLLRDAMTALELVLEEKGLTFTSEQAADSVLKRINQKLG